MNSEIKICQNCNASFIIDAQDFEFYEKIKVPSPTFCPECRLTRRLNYYNVSSIYKRKCDFTNDDIISIYHTNSPVKFGGLTNGMLWIIELRLILINHF